MRRLIASVLLATGLFVLPVANAFDIPDSIVRQFEEIARDNLSSAKLHDGSFVPPETPEERAKPLLPPDVEKSVVEDGAKMALIESCGLDYRSAYFRFMDAQRAKKIWSDKQMAFMGMLHGIAQGFFYKDFSEKGCTSDMKEALRQKLGQ